MKKILTITLSIILALTACKKGAEGGDKKALLADLKKQQSELNSKITALEKELSANDTTKKQREFPVTVAPVTPSVFNHFIELQGAVVAEDEYYLNSKVPGTITRLKLNVGDRVTAGQVVADIDDDMLQQQLNELQKRYELAKEVFEKQESLWKQNIGSEVQFLTAKNNKEALEKSMATLNKSREYYKVVIPVSGVVDEVMLKLGQVVSPGIPLAKIVNFSKLKLKADVPESYAGKIRTGNSVMINFPDLQKDITGKVGYIGSSVNPTNRTFKVEVPIRGGEAGLLPNMLGVIKVVDYSKTGAIVIPINMIKKDLDGDYVLTEMAGKAKKVPVKVGQLYADQAEILSGLKTGDKLIMTGYENLNDGDVLKVN